MKEYLITGAVVLSISGREKGEIFIITSVDNDYCCLANGTTRTIENPKKKNKKRFKSAKIICAPSASKETIPSPTSAPAL